MPKVYTEDGQKASVTTEKTKPEAKTLTSLASTPARPRVTVEIQQMGGQKAPKERSEHDVAVGGRLKSRREEMGLSQRDMAKLLGVSVALIWQYESGMVSVPGKRAEQLSAVLAVSTDYILSGGASDEEHKAHTPVERQLLAAARRLDPDRMRMLQRFLRMLEMELQAEPAPDIKGSRNQD
jgi:transcriptional regulator with XRE-family HTH domain